MTMGEHVHGWTKPTDDVKAWLATVYPAGGVRVDHTTRCEVMTFGNECLGDCPVIDS